MKIYGIPNCDIIKKTTTWLTKNKIAYHFHNYKELGISKAKLEEWLEQVPLTTIFNTRSTTFKELGLDVEEILQSKPKAIKLMMEHNSIIKRPVAETAIGLLVGFKEDEWKKLLQ